MKKLTTNEMELIDMIRTAEEPEKALKIALETLADFLGKNNITKKIIQLIYERYATIEDFINAADLNGQKAISIINGKEEPTTDEVIIIAKTLNKAPEEIAEIFLELHN